MSTKMSTDMNITRPSSRVIRAPGGGSSIVFGDAAPAVAPAKKVEAAPAPGTTNSLFTVVPTRASVVVEAPPAAAAAEAAPKVVVSGKVGVVVAGNVASDSLRDAIVKALVIEGISGTVVSTVAEVAVLPYAAQNLAKSVDVVIAAAFVINDTNGAVSQSLNSALLNVGVNGGKPIVPALIAQSSLLEAKAVLPDHATSWAKAAAAVLGLGEVEATLAVEPEIKVVPALTPAVLNANDLLDIFRESLKSHGASGIIGIGRKFRIADDNNSGTVELSEFSKVVHEHALQWSNAQIKALFDNFDKDKSGNISFDEFIQGLRGDLNDRRKQLVLMAFEILDADKSGVIELNDIKAKYNAKKHPDVISGKTTEDAILREFLNTFDQGEKDGKVTPAEFIQYYGNVSSSIDNDDYFELMIRNAWHISGGEGWCANTSCRRVLVTHKDGRQTVEEIKNDLGISGDDLEAIIAKLVEQGIDDIETVELAGGKKSKVEVPNEAPKTAAPSNVAAGTKPLGAGGEHVNRPPTAAASNNPRRQPGGASTLVLG